MQPKLIAIVIILVVLLVLYVSFVVASRFYGLFAMYNCVTTNFVYKWSKGKLATCFKRVEPMHSPQTCAQVANADGIYGFCYDPDNYGVGVGEAQGPYGYTCSDWVFDKEQCYPETCEAANATNTNMRFGWCAERNRAYRGSVCGPDKAYGISCQKWIWNAVDKCPKQCVRVVKSPPKLPKCPPPPLRKKLPRCPTEDACECN